MKSKVSLPSNFKGQSEFTRTSQPSNRRQLEQNQYCNNCDAYLVHSVPVVQVRVVFGNWALINEGRTVGVTSSCLKKAMPMLKNAERGESRFVNQGTHYGSALPHVRIGELVDHIDLEFVALVIQSDEIQPPCQNVCG